jgi:hypothetical protein
LKVFGRPFQEGNAGHVVGPFNGKERHVELHADRERRGRWFSWRRDDMNPMDTAGSQEACSEQHDDQPPPVRDPYERHVSYRDGWIGAGLRISRSRMARAA